jgi:hypothetical protein
VNPSLPPAIFTHEVEILLRTRLRVCVLGSVWAVIGRLGAMYGKEENCGDLLFSGHTAFAITSLLSALSGSYMWPTRTRNLVWLLAVAYFSVFIFFMLSARKHYTVDVWLGVVVSSLVFVVFSDAWLPPYFRSMLNREKATANKVGGSS